MTLKTTEPEHNCDDCGREADVCYCTKHMEERTTEAYDNGFKEGRKEGYEDGKNEVTNNE